MRRIARLMFTFSSAVPLVLCVATLGQWAFGGTAGTRLGGGTYAAGEYEIACGGGELLLRILPYPIATPDADASTAFHSTTVVAESRERRLLPGVRRVEHVLTVGGAVVARELHIAMWLVALVSAAAPVAWLLRLRRWRRSARSRRGLCRDCGYDLRASPERCPECGAAAAGAGV